MRKGNTGGQHPERSKQETHRDDDNPRDPKAYIACAEALIHTYRRRGKISDYEGQELEEAVRAKIHRQFTYLCDARSYRAVLRTIVHNEYATLVKANLPYVELVVPHGEMLLHIFTNPRLREAPRLKELTCDCSRESAFRGHVSWHEYESLLRESCARVALLAGHEVSWNTKDRVSELPDRRQLAPGFMHDLEAAFSYIAKKSRLWARRVWTVYQRWYGLDFPEIAAIAGVDVTVLRKDVQSVWERLIQDFPEFREYLN